MNATWQIPVTYIAIKASCFIKHKPLMQIELFNSITIIIRFCHTNQIVIKQKKDYSRNGCRSTHPNYQHRYWRNLCKQTSPSMSINDIVAIMRIQCLIKRVEYLSNVKEVLTKSVPLDTSQLPISLLKDVASPNIAPWRILMLNGITIIIRFLDW